MNLTMLSILIRGSVGGLWGLTAVVLAYVLEGWSPVLSALFYPLIFAGAVPAAVLFSGNKLPVMRVVFVGLVSGMIYGLLSPLFPLLAAILAGASLGGGLAQNSDKPGDSLALILSTLKGALVLPILILIGSIISGPLSIGAGAPPYQWLFWGFWSAVCVMLIRTKGENEADHELVTCRRSGLDDFCSEAKEISREISELNLKLDR